MKTKAFRAALPYTLPICVGFLFLGMSYGFFMRSQGFSFVYPLLMSLFIFAGSMEFVTANLLPCNDIRFSVNADSEQESSRLIPSLLLC